MNHKKICAVAAMAVSLAGVVLPFDAYAKLPTPSPEAQAKKDEAKARTAFADKVAAYQLCLAQDRVAAAYRKGRDSATAAASDIPVCQDPGAYGATQEATKVGVADSLPLNKEPVKK